MAPRRAPWAPWREGESPRCESCGIVVPPPTSMNHRAARPGRAHGRSSMKEGPLSKHRVRRVAMALSVALATGALMAGARPAAAAGQFDFLFSMSNVHNDSQYFLNLAVSNYGYQPAVLQPVLPRVRYVEADLPVLMFLQQNSGWPLPQLVDLRASGASWSVIFTRVGVPQDVLFVGMPEDPGPPYGNAWGYWKKHPRGARLNDHDVCDLVKIQMASSWVGA